MSLIATWHPTYAIFRNPFEWGAFSGDMDRFARLLQGKTRPPPKALIINPTVGQIRKMFESSNGRVATDIETSPEHGSRPWTGKDPTRAKIKAIGLGNTTWGLAFDARKNHVDLKRELAKWYANPNVVKVTHNGPWFDHRILKRYGLPIVRWEDTRDARMALSPTSPLSLGYLASIYDDTNPWKEDEEDDSKGLVFTQNIRDLLKYCAQDCVETARVDEGTRGEEEWGTPRVQRLYRLHKQLSILCAEMHTTGIHVNKMVREFLAWGLQEEFNRWETELLALVNHKNFRCTPNDMRALIYKRHAREDLHRFNLPDPIDPDMYTETGMVSVDFDSLLQQLIDPFCPEELRKIIKVYWKAESCKKARNTFVMSALVDHAIGRDGRIRPGWNSCGTDTGRFSCSEPNVMNLEQLLRYMYTAGPGKTLVHGDWSQLELRVMWAVSGDEVLGDALQSGDVYSADAKMIFPQCKVMSTNKLAPDYVGKLAPKQRKASKQVHLGSQYAAGTPAVYAQVLAEDFDAQYTHIATIHEAWKKVYKGTVQYWEDEKKRVHETGYSETRILQRRRAYPAEPPITEIANYPIQGTAADIKNLMELRLRKRLWQEIPSARLVTDLHDAVDVECWENDSKQASIILREEMERPIIINGRRYVFPTEIKVAQSWGDL